MGEFLWIGFCGRIFVDGFLWESYYEWVSVGGCLGRVSMNGFLWVDFCGGCLWVSVVGSVGEFV